VNEFFVGYLPKAPAGIARLIRWVVLCLFVTTALLALTLVASQSGFPASVFEYTQVREFHGVMEESPYPALLVRRPGVTETNEALSRFLLVGEGKHGANDQVVGLSGKSVKLNGKLIYRDNQTLIEVMNDSVSVLQGGGPASGGSTNLGHVILSGEIVDTKCYLGVMNPGEGKVHRDCAALCLRGGIPPALMVRDSSGDRRLYVLVDSQGQPLQPKWAADRAGRPITLSGMLVRSSDTQMLQVIDPRQP
jgi:hypothetical protein